MSFILDALRKAESARSAPVPPPRESHLGDIAPAATSSARWPLLASLALAGAVVIAAAAWWLGRAQPAPDPRVAVVETPASLPVDDSRRELRPLDREVRRALPAPTQQAPVPGPAASPIAPAAARRGTVVVSEQPLSAGADEADPRETVTPANAARRGTVVVSEQPLSAGADEADLREAVTPTNAAPGALDRVAVRPPATQEQLPGYQELVLSGRAQLPPLHLDLHVYAEEPGRRFVFVNNRKYREGERLDEGGRVERITPLGVVLEHRGHRFELVPD